MSEMKEVVLRTGLQYIISTGDRTYPPMKFLPKFLFDAPTSVRATFAPPNVCMFLPDVDEVEIVTADLKLQTYVCRTRYDIKLHKLSFEEVLQVIAFPLRAKKDDEVPDRYFITYPGEVSLFDHQGHTDLISQFVRNVDIPEASVDIEFDPWRPSSNITRLSVSATLKCSPEEFEAIDFYPFYLDAVEKLNELYASEVARMQEKLNLAKGKQDAFKLKHPL